MGKTWCEIFDRPRLEGVGVGDMVVVNIVNSTIEHVALLPRKVERATPCYIWADGIKFKRTGARVRERKSDRKSVILFEMTEERKAYLIATGRWKEEVTNATE